MCGLEPNWRQPRGDGPSEGELDGEGGMDRSGQEGCRDLEIDAPRTMPFTPTSAREGRTNGGTSTRVSRTTTPSSSSSTPPTRIRASPERAVSSSWWCVPTERGRSDSSSTIARASTPRERSPTSRWVTTTLKVDYSREDLPVYQIHIDEGDLGFDLTYTSEVHGWKPGDGYSHFGDLGYFAWVVPFPRARVEGTVRIGDERIDARGVGYHDHNWLNFQFPRIIDYWMWGRIYSETLTVCYAFIQCNKKVDNHAVKVLMAARNEEVVLDTGSSISFREASNTTTA